ncbi:MAG: uracil-DNA glycosylase family protein [Devosiaceae bacterium]
MDQHALKELLEFYDAAGVDASLGNAPVDRFAVVKEPPSAKLAAAPLPAEPPTQQPDPPHVHNPEQALATQDGLAQAQALATQAQTLEELHAALAGFDGCSLKKTARNLVFADGNPQANIMLIGEAPGREEDAQGLPFVGRSGQLLDKMLGAIGLDRTKVYIGNVIYWRPPGNRTPTPQERAICEPFIRRQIELCAPKVMMTLGGSALSCLFGINGIMKTRGQVLPYEHGDLSLPCVPTLHPAALLRNPINKRLAWHDLLALQALIEEHKAQ